MGERRAAQILKHLVLEKQDCASTSSFFEGIKEAPPDPILGITLAFQADTHPDKLNLGVGAYRTEEGKPLVLNCVRKAEQKILELNHNKEYLPIDGLPEFNKTSQKLVFGAKLVSSRDIITTQTLSGTGALRVGIEFLHKHVLPNASLYISDPTWVNHFSICKETGVTALTYRYFNAKTNSFDFEGMITDIKEAPKGSIILLHACAHNPTGSDPSKDQWHLLADVIKQKQHFTFFDTAYQGFATGDLDQDAYAIRYFAEQGLEMLVAQSYAKNFGLYAERAGALHCVCRDALSAKLVLSQIKVIIRANYSNPPKHGALIVATILSDPKLYQEWQLELLEMSGRIKLMRQLLYDAIKANKTPGDWENIKTQIGMFSYTGLSPTQCDKLTNKYHIYLTRNGRISMPGLTIKTIQYLAAGIHNVVTSNK